MKIKLFFLFFSFLLLFFFPWKTQASDCQVVLGARDALSGDIIYNVKFELWEQGENINDQVRPIKSLGSATSDKILGKATIKYKCFSGSKAVKVSVLGKELTDFWYYNFSSDEMVFNLSALRVIYRNGDGTLRKNVKFDLYTQGYDADYNPIREKKDFLGSYDTGESAYYTLYLPQGSVRSLDRRKNDLYVIETTINGAKMTEYDLYVRDSSLTEKDYTISGLKISAYNGRGEILPEKTGIEIYEQQKDTTGQNSLGKKINGVSINNQGLAYFDYLLGTYALVVKDSAGQQNIFYNNLVEKEKQTAVDVKTNSTQVYLQNEAGQNLALGTDFTIFALNERDGANYKDKQLFRGKTSQYGYGELSLAPGTYLAQYSKSNDKGAVNYGVVFSTQNGGVNNVYLKTTAGNQIKDGQKFNLKSSASGISSALSKRVAGKVLLQVEDRGQAWYVDTKSLKRYRLQNGEDALRVMRSLGVGIKNSDLAKILGGIVLADLVDSDGDGLPDAQEVIWNTMVYTKDTDDDSYDDATEILNGYNPLGAGKMSIDNKFSQRHLGRIFLQVEDRGQAWYINPKDGRRYALADGETALVILRSFGLGISNRDLAQIADGSLD